MANARLAYIGVPVPLSIACHVNFAAYLWRNLWWFCSIGGCWTNNNWNSDAVTYHIDGKSMYHCITLSPAWQVIYILWQQWIPWSWNLVAQTLSQLCDYCYSKPNCLLAFHHAQATVDNQGTAWVAHCMTGGLCQYPGAEVAVNVTFL